MYAPGFHRKIFLLVVNAVKTLIGRKLGKKIQNAEYPV